MVFSRNALASGPGNAGNSTGSTHACYPKSEWSQGESSLFFLPRGKKFVTNKFKELPTSSVFSFP
jgi:hypothetical protein